MFGQTNTYFFRPNRTCLDDDTEDPPTLMLFKGDDSMKREITCKISVLLSSSINLFTAIQALMSWIQCPDLLKTMSRSCGFITIVFHQHKSYYHTRQIVSMNDVLERASIQRKLIGRRQIPAVHHFKFHRIRCCISNDNRLLSIPCKYDEKNSNTDPLNVISFIQPLQQDMSIVSHAAERSKSTNTASWWSSTAVSKSLLTRTRH